MDYFNSDPANISLNIYDLKQRLKSEDSKNLIICKGKHFNLPSLNLIIQAIRSSFYALYLFVVSIVQCKLDSAELFSTEPLFSKIELFRYLEWTSTKLLKPSRALKKGNLMFETLNQWNNLESLKDETSIKSFKTNLTRMLNKYDHCTKQNCYSCK